MTLLRHLLRYGGLYLGFIGVTWLLHHEGGWQLVLGVEGSCVIALWAIIGIGLLFS